MRGFCVVIVFVVVNALSANGEDYQEKALKLHNEYRTKHGSPDLALDADLSKNAVTCAKYYSGKKTVDMSCPESKGVGQNIFIAMGEGLTMDILVDLAVKQWYEGEKKYDYTKAEFSSGSAGFTQLVWKSSTKLGFGCELNKDYSVCMGFYTPQGNVVGYFDANVLKSS